MKPKSQRLALVGAAIVAVLLAVLLAMWGLREKASYFYTPAEISAGKAPSGEPIRLGGMVERGSIKRGGDGLTISFVVTDGQAQTPVTYRGIVPDLFREGSGVVAEGRLGDGRQWTSWIHLDDLIALVEFSIATTAIHGAVNAVAPNPVTNTDFTRALASALHRPAIFPVPAAALRLLLGEMSQVVLASQRVIPQAAARAGFQFRFTEAGEALRQIFAA